MFIIMPAHDYVHILKLMLALQLQSFCRPRTLANHHYNHLGHHYCSVYYNNIHQCW